MSAPVDHRPVRRPDPPAVVVLSVALWLGAILAGVAESLVRLAGPAPPTAGELATRGGIYLVLAVLVVALRSGQDTVRWTVVGVLGAIGMLSLVVEPVRALRDGATVSGFLVTASGPDLAGAALRTLHVGAVLVALALLFHPVAHRFFRPARART